MAERRMFAKTIIDSDAFIDMPLSTQALYFHLSMRADDEGFINSPKKIQRMVGATEDDLKLLIAKNFIIPFESGVVVIKHWKIHNYIRKDRITATVYQEEKKQLVEKDNGAYTFNKYELLEEETEETPRQKAYRESSLPYSFEYKIRQAFVGEKCPICGCTMNYANNLVQPTIQHNIPINKGGKHELDNISVICRKCNSSIQDNETGKLNNEKVIEKWDEIQCPPNVGQMSAQVRLGKDSIGKDNIKENNKKKNFVKPTIEEIENYINENNLNVNAQNFYDYYESNGWMVGHNHMKSYQATLRRWSRTNKDISSPSWINKEIKKQETTKEELEELNKLLEGFNEDN